MVPSREGSGWAGKGKWCLSQAVKGPEWGRDSPSRFQMCFALGLVREEEPGGPWPGELTFSPQ